MRMYQFSVIMDAVAAATPCGEPHPNRHVGVPRCVLGNEGRPRGARRTGFGTLGSPRTTLDGYLRSPTATKRELDVALGRDVADTKHD
jgi:hypothetical protein